MAHSDDDSKTPYDTSHDRRPDESVTEWRLRAIENHLGSVNRKQDKMLAFQASHGERMAQHDMRLNQHDEKIGEQEKRVSGIIWSALVATISGLASLIIAIWPKH